jgi:adenylosuccinate lyase
MLNKFIQVIEGLNVYPENMMANLIKTKGLIFSQRVLLRLMDSGMPRMKAYDIVQRAAMRTWKEGIDFKASLMLESEALKRLNEKELDKIFDLNYYLRKVNTIFSRVFLK